MKSYIYICTAIALMFGIYVLTSRGLEYIRWNTTKLVMRLI